MGRSWLLKGRSWLLKGRLVAIRAEERGQIQAQGKGNVACQLDKVRPEALEVDGESVGWRVNVQRLVRCLLPAKSAAAS